MELIERIGAYLGLAAFLGLGTLALLYFQQGREVRRLREWAGRAPERAAAAAAEAESGLGAEQEPEEERGPSLGQRLGARWTGLVSRLPAGIGERLPAPRYMALIAVGLVLIGVGVATGGFGLVGEDEPAKRKGKKAAPPAQTKVAVLNGTAPAEGEPGVPGLAATVGDEVKKLGYGVGPVSDAGAPFGESVVMYDGDAELEAERVAGDVEELLGKTPVQRMTSTVRDLTSGAMVAIVIGQDDAEL